MSRAAWSVGPVRWDRAGRRAGVAVRRLRTTAARHPLLHDVLLAAAVAVVSVVTDVLDPGLGRTAWVFDLLPSVPLLARRRRPTLVFAVVAALLLLQYVAGVQAHDFVVLVALYAVGAYEPRRRWVAAAALTAEVGVVLATLRWAPQEHRLSAVLLLTGTVTAAWVAGVYVRTRRAYLAEIVERAATAERERDSRAQLAVAAERARIVREMHDVVAHSISVMVALSDGAAATAEVDAEAASEASRQASAAGRQALTEMHRLLGVLRTGDGFGLAPQPGLAQLEDLLAPVRAAGLRVEMVEVGDRGTSPPSVGLAVYRLVQESLTNVLKHGRRVTWVVVTVVHGPDGLQVTVDDDGAAPVPQPARTRTGLGLAGMRERLAASTGTLSAGPRPGGGWRVAGRIPADDAWTSAAVPSGARAPAPLPTTAR